jgi:hypothetical protein
MVGKIALNLAAKTTLHSALNTLVRISTCDEVLPAYKLINMLSVWFIFYSFYRLNKKTLYKQLEGPRLPEAAAKPESKVPEAAAKPESKVLETTRRGRDRSFFLCQECIRFRNQKPTQLNSRPLV